MEPGEIYEAIAIARGAAAEASGLIMQGFRQQTQVTKKGEIDLVTEWDLRSERLIVDRLGAAFPDHRIVAEEGATRGEGELAWYVDPIDGTTNFSHGHPFFCVSIGLFQDTQPILGVVNAPALGVEWWGAPGLGLHRNDSPASVSSADQLSEALVATGFPYDRWANPDDNLREYRAFLKRCRGVRRCGSAALDLALTADGTYALFWEQRLSPWDLAAGAALVSAAGGQLSDYDGSSADIRTGRIVATNGRLHQEAIRVLKEARSAL